MIEDIVMTAVLVIGFFVFIIFSARDIMAIAEPIVNYTNNQIEGNFIVKITAINSTKLSIVIINNNKNFTPAEYCFNNECYSSNAKYYIVPRENFTIYAVNGSENFEIYSMKFS